MKKLERLFFVSIAALGLAACSSELDVAGDAIGDVKHVSMNVADFEWAEGEKTRTTAVNNGGKVSFNWSENDTVGIYPNVGSQVEFPIEAGAGTGTAVFNGGGWALKSQSTYVAYYPFSKSNYFNDGTSLPISYEGQTQVGNDNLDNLTKCDYIVSSVTAPSDGNATFDFKHIGALVRFVLTVPEDGTFTEFTLSSESEIFPVGQTMNVRTNPVAITNKTLSKSISMSLSDINVSAGGTVTLYMLLPAVNLNAKSLTATLARGYYNRYSTTITGKNYESGKAYSYSATLDKVSSLVNAEYVDLGLPSGTLWATCNIGAVNPEDYGDYFAWGETAGYNSGKTTFDWTNYSHCNGSSSSITKYSSSDSKTELDLEDDAAHVNWGDGWRVPSKEQYDELINSSYTTRKVSTQNGVSGLLLTSRVNGNSIFLPFGGYRNGSSLKDVKSRGNYATRNLSTDAYNYELRLYSSGNTPSTAYTRSRCNGQSIRPVKMKEKHEYVDLGLPSGTLWATCNIGAENPEDYGDYFAWGETTGYYSGKMTFDWENYKWCSNGSWTGMTKYTYPDGWTSGIWYSGSTFIGDNKTELDPEDDAAYVNWGSEWRMPTHAQLQELVNSSYTTTTWTTFNGVYGRKISKKTDDNVYIFLPAAGYRNGSSLSSAGSYGNCWSRSLDTSDSCFGWILDFNSSDICADSYNSRYYGRSVRPVRSASE